MRAYLLIDLSLRFAVCGSAAARGLVGWRSSTDVAALVVQRWGIWVVLGSVLETVKLVGKSWAQGLAIWGKRSFPYACVRLCLPSFGLFVLHVGLLLVLC